MADNPFAGGSTGSAATPDNPFARGGSTTLAKGGGGGGVLGLLGKTASELEHAAINAPAGLYKLGKDTVAPGTHPSWGAVGQQWKDLLHGKLDNPQNDPLAADVKGMAASVEESAQHPLRHPGLTLLNLLPVVSGLSKAAIVGAEGARGLEAGALSQRTLRSGDLTVHPEASRSGLGIVATKATDKLLQNAADKNPAGRGASLLNRKIGKTITAEAKQATRNAKGPAARLVAIGRKLTPGEQKALQLVAEQAPLNERITAASARVTGARDTATRTRHQEELTLLHEAKQHLAVDETGKPMFAPTEAKLPHVYKLMTKVAGDRETLLKNLGQLSDEAIQSRTTNAGRVALGASKQDVFLPASTADLEVGATVRVAGKNSLGKIADRTAAHATVFYPRFNRSVKVPISKLEVQGHPEIQGAEHFTPDANAIRIPDVATKQGTKSLGRMGAVGAQGTIGHLKAPGSTTHEYGGVLREEALRRQDTAQLVGESGLEAAKFAGLTHIHNLVRQATAATPTRPDDIAVRLDDLGSHEKTPLEVRKFLGDPEEFFKTTTQHEQATMLDKVRQQLFIQPQHLDAGSRAEFEKLNQAGKIGWVPKRILGELGNPAAPLRAVAPGKTIGTVDAINNASRFAILYLKPAYAIPNVLGNSALSIIQQGWAAPRNLAQAAKLVQKLSDEDYARIDAAMGEGVALAVSAHGQGRASRVVDFAAGKWSSVVDTPFRRAAFLHEARQAGFKTPEQINELLSRDAHDPQLIRVGLRSNRDAIDYENLTPTEREIVRRVVFFYPWVKGSTVYAGRFLREHPVKAAATGQIGALGQQYSQGAFGNIPSYLEGLIPAGVSRAINPNSAAILQTPAQLAEAIQGLATGNIPEAAQALQFATPAVSLALAAATRRDSGGYPYKPGHRDILHIAEDQLVGQLPQMSLYHELQAALSGNGGSKLYPPSISGALGKFLVGGLYPRKVNKQRLNDLAASEQTKIRTGR